MSAAPLAERLADLAVRLGANVQPGQIVSVSADIGLEEVVREVAAAAYQRGAKFVDVSYYDPHVKRARIEHAEYDTLDFVPRWYGDRVFALGESHAARVVIAGPSYPHALDGLDPDRLGRDPLPAVAEWMEVVADRTVNWTIVPYPTLAWAKQVHPELDDEAAFETLCREIVHVCRLDEPDPDAAWRERVDELTDVGSRLNALRSGRAPLRGAGDRSHGRAASQLELDRRGLLDGRRARAPPERPRPRRCSRRPIRTAPRATCARRRRSCSWTGRSCAGSRSASRAAARSRSTPRRAPR